MPKYLIEASETFLYESIVEAKSEEEAKEYFLNHLPIPKENADTFKIDNITELTKKRKLSR